MQKPNVIWVETDEYVDGTKTGRVIIDAPDTTVDLSDAHAIAEILGGEVVIWDGSEKAADPNDHTPSGP